MRTGFLILLGLAACGGSTGGGSGGGPIAPDQLAAAIGRVNCGKLGECCTTQEFMDETLAPRMSRNARRCSPRSVDRWSRWSRTRSPRAASSITPTGWATAWPRSPHRRAPSSRCEAMPRSPAAAAWIRSRVRSLLVASARKTSIASPSSARARHSTRTEPSRSVSAPTHRPPGRRASTSTARPTCDVPRIKRVRQSSPMAQPAHLATSARAVAAMAPSTAVMARAASRRRATETEGRFRNTTSAAAARVAGYRGCQPADHDPLDRPTREPGTQGG